MIVRTKFLWKQTAAELWPAFAVIVVYSLTVALVDELYHLERLHLPVNLATLPGASIGVLLAFRTNSGYSRWWEARILWGQIVNDCRTLARQLKAFVGSAEESNSDIIKTICYRQVAWCYVLAQSLRSNENLFSECRGLLDGSEIEEIKQHDNMPNAILELQANDIADLNRNSAMSIFEFVQLDSTLVRLTNSMGGCERIRNTPFPPSYGMWIHYLIYLFIALLPFALVDMPWIAQVLVVAPIATGFLIIDKVAMNLENPFAAKPWSTPMLALSRTIEINIRQSMGETQIPAKMEPDDDILY